MTLTRPAPLRAWPVAAASLMGFLPVLVCGPAYPGESVAQATTVACCAYLRAEVWRFGTLEREVLRPTRPEGLHRHVYRARECPADPEFAAANPPREIWACVLEAREPRELERLLAMAFDERTGRLVIALASPGGAAAAEIEIHALEVGKEDFPGPPHAADGTVDLTGWSAARDTRLARVTIDAGGSPLTHLELLPAMVWPTPAVDHRTLIAVLPRARDVPPRLWKLDVKTGRVEALELTVEELPSQAPEGSPQLPPLPPYFQGGERKEK